MAAGSGRVFAAGGPTEIVAIGDVPDGAGVWTSTDGSAWTRSSGGVFAGARAETIAAKGDTFVVGGGAATGSPPEAIIWVGK